MPELEGVALECAAAERVMGWPHNPGDPESTYPHTFITDHGDLALAESWISFRLWSPLRSMDAAWEVVIAMQAKGWTYRLTGYSESRPEKFTHSMSFYNDDGGHASKYGSSPGEAILRAALAAEGEKDA